MIEAFTRLSDETTVR